VKSSWVAWGLLPGRDPAVGDPMHRFLSFLLVPVLCLPVLNLPLVSSRAWAADPPKPDTAPAHPARRTWEQHFTQANLAHDGHLTLEEAKGGYADVAKHFDDVDADHKGHVTANDIRAWRVMRKAARRVMKLPEEKPRPRSTAQRADPDFRTITVSGRASMSASIGLPAAKQ
jgi:hypothetical protein